MKTLTKFVVFSISVILVYTVIAIVLFMKTGMESSTLTTCVYAFFGTEIGSCALIELFKRKYGDKEDE